MSGATDEELMSRYQAGEVAAFDLLYLRYERRIYSFLLRLVGDKERCAELFQETFLQLHEHRQQYDPERPFGAWIFRIARNLAYNEIRRVKRQGPVVEIGGDRDEAIRSNQPDPQEVLEDRQLRQQVDRALQLLSPEQREAILLSYYGGFKYREIAQMTDATEDAVKQRVRRGMQALRDQCRNELPGN